jgi:hypothetical protein
LLGNAPRTIDTETPTLNTRDIILMRNGQRRTSSGPTEDPSVPRVESVGSKGSSTVMSGQSYPAVPPQYHPITITTGTSINEPSLVASPSASTSDASSAPRNRYQPVGSGGLGNQPTQRIQQPAAPKGTSAPVATPPGLAAPYQPLSPVLPDPSDSNDVGSSVSTPNNHP